MEELCIDSYGVTMLRNIDFSLLYILSIILCVNPCDLRGYHKYSAFPNLNKEYFLERYLLLYIGIPFITHYSLLITHYSLPMKFPFHAQTLPRSNPPT